MKKTASRLLALALTAALVLSGCGGGGTTTEEKPAEGGNTTEQSGEKKEEAKKEPAVDKAIAQIVENEVESLDFRQKTGKTDRNSMKNGNDF